MASQQSAQPAPVLSAQALEAYNKLVSTLYRCLQDSAGFAPFFHAFQQQFKALQGGILGVSQQSRRLIYGWTFGYPDGFEEWYMNSDLPERDEALIRYQSLPPRQFDSFMRGRNEGSILDLLAPESRAWAEGVGMGDSAGMLICRDASSSVVFVANRHRDYGPYTETDLLQMNLLAPHIENAVALYLKLYQSSNDNENLALALNHVKKPLVVFNALGNVAQANDAARDLLARSGELYIADDHRLHCREAQMSRKVANAISTSIVHSHQGKLETRTLFIQTAAERLALCLTPLVAERAENNGVLAELFSFTDQQAPDLARLQSLFDCTRAEAGIAGDLVQGLSASDIAERRHISVHTARQHIKNLLGKNGYRKQTELVSMLVRALG
ncbi:helix-turn-helix transcriptional regulator [Halopseudomonas maritima]|uniref:helix-turn-helix transcriptional regulator n=1 Tax=Halopseudomonas maritima TaxID=2918528 RepID=UPI001EEADFEA|nr:helix-turn-helix transcriptional regulator [Halopseudomonas maritima]UJJ30130.1 helix-turn-helix transcriptional regulator [Halopseudomonas maritima]